MNIVYLNKILIFFCIFPSWLFLSNISFHDKLFFSIPYIFIIILFFFYLQRDRWKKYQILFFSIIITWGLDQNFLLEKKLIKSNLSFFLNTNINLYYVSIILLILIFFFTYSLIYFFKRNAIKLILPFIVTISIFNYYDIFRGVEVKNFNLSGSYNNQQVNEEKRKVLFIILDEMSGFNSAENKFINGSKFKKELILFAKKNRLTLFSNAYSLSDNTATSVPGIVNFKDTHKELLDNRKNNLAPSGERFYNEYIVLDNKLFDQFQSISLFQNIHLDFCINKNVKKCYQFNPYKKNNHFIEGYKYNSLTRFFSIWKIQGSIIAKLFWRAGRELQITDSYLEPEVHKSSFEFLLDEITKDLIADKFGLVFAHLLVPHIPYGFDENCKYNGKLSLRNTSWSNEKKIVQHNQERLCIVHYLDKFFSIIKNKTDYTNLEIFILSDHGSRISGTYDSRYSSIFMHKSKNSQFFVNQQKLSVQFLVKNLLME